MIPGLENAEFVRFGQIHRNTYIDSPKLLHPTLQLRSDASIFFAGQLTGVEGYVESSAAGMVAGLNAARLASGLDPITFPKETIIGALLDYITNCPLKRFQPMNANFGIMPPLDPPIKKDDQKKARLVERALTALEALQT
jgi:methylenetetrahydrofolate--tRNA-(uracil-5-)-methyltransferase